jgi:hypothetical protein
MGTETSQSRACPQCAMARASYLGSARAMALAPATGRILPRRVAGFVSAVDNTVLNSEVD